MSYDFRKEVDHIGYISNQIVVNNKLPTIKQVLAVLFYNLKRLSNSLRDSANLAIDECLVFWKKARVPTKEHKKCVIKLESEYERWRKITRNATRRTETQIRNEQAYEESLDKLFDIASANALEVMVDEYDKEFLIWQRGN